MDCPETHRDESICPISRPNGKMLFSFWIIIPIRSFLLGHHYPWVFLQNSRLWYMLNLNIDTFLMFSNICRFQWWVFGGVGGWCFFTLPGSDFDQKIVSHLRKAWMNGSIICGGGWCHWGWCQPWYWDLLDFLKIESVCPRFTWNFQQDVRMLQAWRKTISISIIQGFNRFCHS